MDIGFEHKAGLSARGCESACTDARADWLALRMRLSAAYAARCALAEDRRCSVNPAGGSFDSRSARILTVYGNGSADREAGVNPNVLGNGKSSEPNDPVSAGATTTGDRG